MPLPPVQGWLIDYRTAHAIFGSQSNERIAHCVAACQGKSLHICHSEEDRFREDSVLSPVFIQTQNCVYYPDDDIFARCNHIAEHVNSKRRLAGNESAVFITATAMSKKFGVISDHSSPSFATVRDLCSLYGVHVLSADEYFSMI